jgi:1-deoxy-D-xylulose-5-phosphate reductoisomerase
MKKLAILGSTGSIGRQTLEVVRQFPERFKVVSLSCETNLALLKKQIFEFRPLLVRVKGDSEAFEIQTFIRENELSTSVTTGKAGNIECAVVPDADVVVAAMVGVCGLEPVVEAILAGKDIALANKETLVAGGSIVMPLALQHEVRILPVDSEHSAVWQCLHGQPSKSLDRILLTASGGPFRGNTREKMSTVTAKDALAHPTWTMGGKITVDSATMMNKGLEVIEASWLFDFPVEQIDVVVHPQSIIHSMIRLTDGSVLAQMGRPDMMLPIQVALFHPQRSRRICEPFDPFAEGCSNLTFERCNTDLFPCLALAYHAGKVKGSLPAVMNSANEEAVSAFLCGKIGFLDIERYVSECMNTHEREGVAAKMTVHDIYEIDNWSRGFVRDRIAGKIK